MRIFTDPEETRRQCAAWRKAGESVALVPTMGYYHAGHESLMRWARENADKALVSLFVNPTQFGPEEDLEAYPRDFERDAAIAEKLGVDALFCPSAESLYHDDHATWVEVPELAKGLCGASRPIHFRGVCTIVLKLLLLTGADIAVFGQKDWQQQAIIKRMARDLNLAARIVSLPAVREADGLAMSSRNVYLSAEERRQAPKIREGLLRAREACARGETDVARLREDFRDFLRENAPLGEIDYVEIVHPETLEKLTNASGPALMACAARFGKARLIDNALLRE